MADQIFLVNSSSISDISISSSLRAIVGSVIDFIQASTVTGSFSGRGDQLTRVSASYIVPSANTTASFAISSSFAPQSQNISVNSITASFISASGEIIVPTPINPQNAVPKYYVDNINPQGLQAYFRSDLDLTLPQYYQMHDLSVPLSASANTITITSVSSSQYIFSFVSFGIGVTNINAGNFNVHFHAWFTGGGSAALSVTPEFWLRSGSVETFVADEAPITLDQTVNKEYTGQITLTSSIVTNPTDRAIVKFKVFSQNQTPDAFMRVDGQTSAGITIPVPSSNFVLKAGDTMTGNLTVPQVIGTASFAITASHALNASSTAVSSSWASSSLSSSYIIPGATLYVVSSSTNPSYIEPYNIPVDPYNPPYKEGRMFYDSDFHNWVYYPESDFKLHIGKEVIWRIHNPYNTTLTSTTVVYISGSTGGGLPDAYKAIADGTGTKSDVVGIIRHDIPSGSFGYVLCNGVIHDVNVGSFQVGDQLWLSPTISGTFVNADPGQPYESIRIGSCQESGMSGSIALNIYTQAPPPNVFAGIVSIPTVTNNNNGTVTISSASCNLYSNSTGSGTVITYNVPESTLSMSIGVDVTNYVFADYNNGTPEYQVYTFNAGNSLSRVAVTFINIRAINTSSYDMDNAVNDTVGLALANKLLAKDTFVFGLQRQSGYIVSETGSLGIAITAGASWLGVKNFVSPAVNSIGGTGSMYFFYHSASDWTFQTPVTSVTNQYYDDGTGLVPLSSSYYNSAFIYRLVNTEDEFAYVLSDNQYASESLALLSTPPGGIPSYISSLGMLCARVIIQSGSTNISRIDSAFNIDFVPAVTNEHNNLGGLQGGTGGQYYHLTSTEYAGTGTGTFVRASGATMNGNAKITGSLQGTSSWASNAITATSASNASTASSISFVPTFAVSSSWVSASAFITTAQTASYVTASNVVGTVASASRSTFANTASAISFVPITATSASWVSASAFITTAQTASYVTASNVVGRVSSALTASYAVTASYANTASYLNGFYNSVLSGSDFTNVNLLTAQSLPLSFSINPGETWICESHLTSQSSNNRGLRWAISSSAPLGAGMIGGQVQSNTNALTSFTSARITAVNAIVATTVHTQANTPGMDQIYFSILNPISASTISIAMAMLNVADTGTAFEGSYLMARRVI